MCKSKLLERRVLRCVKSCFGDALKTRVSKMQYPLREMLVFFIFLQYLLYDLADYDVSSVTSRALPTSEMTILA